MKSIFLFRQGLTNNSSFVGEGRLLQKRDQAFHRLGCEYFFEFIKEASLFKIFRLIILFVTICQFAFLTFVWLSERVNILSIISSRIAISYLHNNDKKNIQNVKKTCQLCVMFYDCFDCKYSVQLHGTHETRFSANRERNQKTPHINYQKGDKFHNICFFNWESFPCGLLKPFSHL